MKGGIQFYTGEKMLFCPLSFVLCLLSFVLCPLAFVLLVFLAQGGLQQQSLQLLAAYDVIFLFDGLGLS